MQKVGELKVVSRNDPYARPIEVYVREVPGGSGEDYLVLIHLPFVLKMDRTVRDRLYHLAWEKIKTWQAQAKTPATTADAVSLE